MKRNLTAAKMKRGCESRALLDSLPERNHAHVQGFPKEFIGKN